MAISKAQHTAQGELQYVGKARGADTGVIYGQELALRVRALECVRDDLG